MSVSNNSAGSRAATIDGTGGVVLNATVTDNSFTNSDNTGEAFSMSSDNGATVNLNLNANNANPGNPVGYRLTNDATFAVQEQSV